MGTCATKNDYEDPRRCAGRINRNRLPGIVTNMHSMASDITIAAQELEAKVRQFVDQILCRYHDDEVDSATEVVMPAFLRYRQRLAAGLPSPPGTPPTVNTGRREILEPKSQARSTPNSTTSFAVSMANTKLRAENDQLKKEVQASEKLKSENEKLGSDNNKLQQEVLATKKLKGEITKLKEEVAEIEKLRAVNAKLKQIAAENEKLQAENTKLKGKTLCISLSNADNAQKMAEKNRKIEKQQRENTELRDRIEELTGIFEQGMKLGQSTVGNGSAGKRTDGFKLEKEGIFTAGPDKVKIKKEEE
jgi:regulator of replication initiation timing